MKSAVHKRRIPLLQQDADTAAGISRRNLSVIREESNYDVWIL